MTANGAVAVAVGAWTKITVPVSTDLSGLAVSSSLMVLSGDQGRRLSSPDGSAWTPRASGTLTFLTPLGTNPPPTKHFYRATLH